MPDFDAIIIGSGAGGLAAAVALARAGQRVMVFEQHYLPGGWCHTFPLGGHQFSPGVHYIGALNPGGMMRRVYEGLGVADDMVFLELNPDGYDHILIGDERFDMPRGRERLRGRLKERFPSEAAGIDRYLDLCHQMAEDLMGALPAETTGDLLALPWRMRRILRHGLISLDRFLDGVTQDPLLRAILSMQAGDHGVSPSRVPMIQHAAVANHYFEGGFYPRGGARSIPKAFIKQLRRSGGKIKVKAPVEQILVEGSGRARRAVGVRLADGAEVSATNVISNADPHVTYGRLLADEHVPWWIRRKMRRVEYSIASLSLFFAVDMDLRAAGLDSGNYWYSPTPDVGRLYEVARDPDPSLLEEMPAIFLTATTLKDPSKQRPGKGHTLESFTFVSYEAFRRWVGSEWRDRPQDYERLKARLTELMLERLERIAPGISERVTFSELGTPLTNEHFVAATRGNLYGTEKVLGNLGPFSFPVRTKIPGLYHCGASTVGHGVAAATMSGLGAARMILGCRRDDLLTPGASSLEIYPCDDPASWPERLRPRARR